VPDHVYPAGNRSVDARHRPNELDLTLALEADQSDDLSDAESQVEWLRLYRQFEPRHCKSFFHVRCDPRTRSCWHGFLVHHWLDLAAHKLDGVSI
jgi:hypothetical protein